MLPRAHKVTKQREIEQLAKTGRGFRSRFFMLKSRTNKKQTPRFVLVISAKVSKKAVVRNRLRRQVREIIRHNILKQNKHCDTMIIINATAINQEFADLQQDLLFAYEKSVQKATHTTPRRNSRPYKSVPKNTIS